MNTSGDAAEQVVRLSLEGMEVALKLTGTAAKHMAVMLYAVMKEQEKTKTKGKTRLTSLLKSGKPLTVFTVRNQDLRQFTKEAKKYGVVYCALRGIKKDPDGMCDLLVRSEDAPKINRIVERFQLASVETVDIQQTTEKEERGGDTQHPVPDQGVEEKEKTEQLVEELFAAPMQKEVSAPENPSAAKTEKSPLSEPSLNSPEKSGRAIMNDNKVDGRPSVRETLREIRASRNKTEPKEKHVLETNHPAKNQKVSRHQQPQVRKKKSQIGKER